MNVLHGIINVYKEPGFTSHDVVAKLRGIAGQKKIGHTGTLDPDAEGVLVLCLGRSTKQADHIAAGIKTYEAELLLGVTTDTQDTSGTVTEEREVRCTEEELRAAISRFLGLQLQTPPMYSAKKVKGKKLYELARRGEEVERKAVPVHFYEIELLSFESPRARLRVTCSKGTYIRTLCHDIGQALGCGGCMAHLLRTRVGSFRVETAHRLSELQQAADEGRLEEMCVRTVVTIGKFDGLHRGHQKLVSRVREIAEERLLSSAAFTFAFPGARKSLLTKEERREMLHALGVDQLVEKTFSEEIKKMSPEDFVKEILLAELHAAAVVVGTDFRFGYERAGTPETLRKLGEKYGFTVEVLDKEKDGDRDISSTYVREALAAGNMEKVNELLGYNYSICAEIVHGRKLGRTLGFPTINQVPDPEKALPPYGVYHTRVTILPKAGEVGTDAGTTYRGLTNIGNRPTVDGKEVRFETYLYDCDEDLYGRVARVEILSFVRPEKTFASVDELRAQVKSDIRL